MESTNLSKRIANQEPYFPTFSSMLDRVFNDSVQQANGSRFLPNVDIVENDDAWGLHIAAPGMKKEDFKIEIDNNTLSVSGERKFEKKEGHTYHRVETSFGAFLRSFNLPDNVKIEDVKAKYEDGVLRLEVPKDKQKTAKRKIDIK